jgi:hypothetical protein
MGRGTREVGSSITTGGKNGLVRSESMKSTIFHVKSKDTLAFAIFHDQIESKVLDKVVGLVSERLTVQSVKNGMASTISDGSATISLTT